MTTRKIKQVLKKKGYELLDMRILPWTWQGETEWLILVPKDQQQLIIKHGSDYFCAQDFSGDGYFGGNAEVIAESLEFLPDLNSLEI
ncbi:hypothetical protein DJ533_12060 [Acinetobacter defluvii]|uniref:Uncharacterized protein n=1 Tax=Acinetobacter defluvii TaxID=1871111 RepID=A0A2S2FEA6_9GAMM|nr:hypothetical protein [Acinetobacter defluvii]AWL29248.1 hypothetical protein DJ533_12060 [Acinetobacter defluvii]